MKSIVWTHEATRQFLAPPSSIQERIEEKIAELAINPAALGDQIKALKGSKALRFRVGDYRIIFTDSGVILSIIRIGHRSDVYR